MIALKHWVLSLLVTGMVLSAGVAPSAAAPCTVAISAISPIANIVYNPFDGVVRTVNYTVTFQNSGADACTVGLAIASPAPGIRTFKNGSGALQYTLEWPGGAVFSNNITAPIGAIAVPGNGAVRTVTLRVKMAAGLIAPAATYADTLNFRPYRTASGSMVQSGTDRTAPAGAILEARAQVNIAGTSGSFGTPFALDRLDFGALAAGASRSAIVQIRATSPVSINVSSLNHGRLKHKVLTTDAGVAYSMQLDGSPVALGGATATLNRSPPVSLNGINYPMNLQMGSVTGRPAGDYQDTLTINVAPL